jgi:Kef-type K+ transport system membrane component KefB
MYQQHVDPFAPMLVTLSIITVAAGLGRLLANKLGQAPVLGELLIGVALGQFLLAMNHPEGLLIIHFDKVSELLNYAATNGSSLATVASEIFSEYEFSTGIPQKLISILSSNEGMAYQKVVQGIWIFSNLGLILLLFMVGLENTLSEMAAVGARATVVAIVGIVVPFLLGLLAGKVFLPDYNFSSHLFLAATLCATSVGITARVFKDMGRSASAEARIILGAAVIDDILGLIILSLVVGLATTGILDITNVFKISVQAAVYIFITIAFGVYLLPKVITILAPFFRPKPKVLFPLAMCFLFSWLATKFGLAAIVGAFASGLILADYHFTSSSDEDNLDDLIAPLELLFAPIFFVLMGMQVNVDVLLSPQNVLLASALIVVAVVGKLISGIVAGSGLNRLVVGIGMIPRGEVGLIFASLGKTIGVVDDKVFSAIVCMVIVTTLITPPLLKGVIPKER